MEPKDSLSFEILGLKGSVTGRFAIVAVLLAGIFCGAGYLLGKTYRYW